MNAPSLSIAREPYFRPRSLGPEHTIKAGQARMGNINLMLSLKENARGRFLRVSEKKGERFNTLMIPAGGLKQFNSLLARLIQSNEKAGRFQIDGKDFLLMADEDRQGPFLSIIENVKNHSVQIIIPGEGWETFEKMMNDMVEASEGEPFPFNPVVELKPADSLLEKIIKSTIVQVENKSFKLTLKDNLRGRWLRLTEKAGQRFTCIYIPAAGLEAFKQMLQKTIQVSEQIILPMEPVPSQSPLDDQVLNSDQLQLNEKMFDFILHENIRGRYLRLTETSPGFYPKHVIIPSTGLVLLVKLIDEMIQAADECPMDDPQLQEVP